MQYDVFISHSSVDKEAVARPLAEALQARGLSVWLDEEQLQVGDSIRRGIDKALSQSRFGVVILSPAYLESEWTRKELDALFTKEKYQNKTILPISHQLSREAIEAFSPMLADKITLSTEDDIAVLAGQIHGSMLALPATQKIAVSKGLRPPSNNQNTININVGENTGSVSADTVQGDKIEHQTVINQAINAEELARQLVEKMGVATTEDLQAKDEEIKQLTQTISRLQQQPGDEDRQSALKKLAENKPQEATELLKKSLIERRKARQKRTQQEVKQEAQDWVDVGNIAYLNNTQEALTAYQQATRLDPNNINAWNKLGIIKQRLGQLDEAVQAYETVMKLADDDKSGQAIAYGNLGLIYQTRGELDKAEVFLLKSLKIHEALGRQQGMASGYGNLGVIYQTRGELDKAEAFLLKALNIDKALGRQQGMASNYGNLGVICLTRGELDKAEAFLLKALNIDEALGRQQGMASGYGNLSVIYLTRGELNKAEAFLLKALNIDEALGRQEGMANQYSNLGAIYQTRGELDKAEVFLLKSLKIHEALGRQEGMASNYGNLGLIYKARGELDKAETFLLKSLKINEALGLQQGMATNYANLGVIKKLQGDIKTACQHWQISVDLFKKIGITQSVERVQHWIDSDCPA